MKKRVLSALLALVIALSLMPPVEVAAAEIVASGECGAEGSNVTWTLDSAGTLTISGTGVIKNNVFTGFESKDDRIQSVVIKDGITAISHSTFSGCANLASVTFPPSLTTIGNMAFQDCTSLTNISLPDTITTIGQSAFGRSGLRSIVLPKGITTISQYLLRGSKQLTSVVIPNSVNRIEYRAFAECGSLESITLPESITILESGVFTDCTDLRNLFLPRALTEIGAWCFTGTAIERMDIPENVTTLGSTCFSDCPELTEVCIYGGITDISDYTFARCPKLTKLVLPKSIKKISRYALERSSSIKDIYYSGTKEEWALVEKGDRYECPELYNATIYFDTEPIPTSSPIPTPTPTPTPSPKPSASPSAKPTVPADAEASGECGADGDNVVWWIDKDMTLHLAGNGATADYNYVNYESQPPWCRVEKLDGGELAEVDMANITRNVVVGDGITALGTSLLAGMSKCETVTLGKDVKEAYRDSLSAGYAPMIIFKGGAPDKIDEYAFYKEGQPTIVCETAAQSSMQKTAWTALAKLPYWGISSRDGKIDRSSPLNINWVFGESQYYKLPLENTFSFNNAYGTFKKEDGYYITQKDYDRLTEYLTYSEKQAVTKDDKIHFTGKKKNFNIDGKDKWNFIEWSGSCYGMSAVMSSIMSGQLAVAAIQDVDTVRELAFNKGVQSVINYYQVQQHIKTIEDRAHADVMANSQEEQLNSIIAKVKECMDKGYPPILNFAVYQSEKKKDKLDHAVLAYGVESGMFTVTVNGEKFYFENRILLCDPNTANGAHRASAHAHSLYYNSNKNIWVIPEYGAVSTSVGIDRKTRMDNAQITGIVTDPKFINGVSYLTGVRNYKRTSRAAAPSTPGYIRTASQNLTLTIDGRKVVIKDGLFDGETTISDTGAMIFFPCAGEGSDSYSILLPEGAQYSVTAEEEFSCSLETDDYYLSAASSGAGTASFSAEGAAALDLDGSGPAYLSLTANDSPAWHSFEVTSDKTSYLDLELTDGGFKLEGDGLDGSEFAAYDDEEDAEPQRFSTKEDSLLVTDKDGKAAVFADRDGDGEYETPVDTAPAQEEPMPFTDVKEGAFYYDAVRWAAAKGIVKGTGGTTFSPEGTCTRSQVATFLWRAAGQPKPVSSKSTFTDITPGAFYYDAVLWAQEQGIVQGTGGTSFSPEGPCTRSQVATFLWRAAEKPNPASSKSTFTDITPGAFYYEAVLWAQEQGIVQGTGGTNFSPEGPCTRSQVATFLYRAS